MFWEILLAIVLGLHAGVITGLIPGVHVNLITVILVSSSPLLLPYVSPLALCCFIIAMALTHTFVDAIPSIFLGAPDPAMALNVLPAHKMLLEGNGFTALMLTAIGSLFSLIVTVALIPVMILIAPTLYSLLQPHMAYLLIAVAAYMILKESTLQKKVHAITLFTLAGTLGYVVLNNDFKDPLLPMLSGLFGVATLYLSLGETSTIPPQECNPQVSLDKNTIKATATSTFSGSITGLLPGVGSAQASILGMQLAGDIGDKAFLVLMGGINTVNFTFSLVTAYTLEKARNGAVVGVMQLIPKVTLTHLLMYIGVLLATSGIALLATLKLAKQFALLVCKVNYATLVYTIIGLIIGLTLIMSKWQGILILATSTAIGILAPLLKVKRSHAMGCIILPVILYFL